MLDVVPLLVNIKNNMMSTTITYNTNVSLTVFFFFLYNFGVESRIFNYEKNV